MNPQLFAQAEDEVHTARQADHSFKSRAGSNTCDDAVWPALNLCHLHRQRHRLMVLDTLKCPGVSGRLATVLATGGNRTASALTHRSLQAHYCTIGSMMMSAHLVYQNCKWRLIEEHMCLGLVCCMRCKTFPHDAMPVGAILAIEELLYVL
mmetsp:Transcript_5336/g.7391  ORF Transcript_5336/g.7391 Transcript_5336/m.7391 type:complete len:151 (+) Transcript_5336:234-686(+)